MHTCSLLFNFCCIMIGPTGSIMNKHTYRRRTIKIIITSHQQITYVSFNFHCDILIKRNIQYGRHWTVLFRSMSRESKTAAIKQSYILSVHNPHMLSSIYCPGILLLSILIIHYSAVQLSFIYTVLTI